MANNDDQAAQSNLIQTATADFSAGIALLTGANNPTDLCIDEKLQRSMRAVDEICEIFVKAAININDEFREYTFVKLEETYTADLRLIRLTLIRDVSRRTRDVEKAAEDAEELAQRVQKLSDQARKLTSKSRRISILARKLMNGSHSERSVKALLEIADQAGVQDKVTELMHQADHLTNEAEELMAEAMVAAKEAEKASEDACQSAKNAMHGAASLKASMKVLETVDALINSLDWMKQQARTTMLPVSIET